MATPSSSLYPRFAADAVQVALLDTPVVALNGARQVGKTTLVRGLVDARRGASFVTLDDETQLQAAKGDPSAFVDREGLFVIDEVQRAPALLPAIKAAVDRDRRPGRFLLTGSARLLSTAELGRWLAGRAEVVDLWPLSQGELASKKEVFVDALFAWSDGLRVASELRRSDYLGRVTGGGSPSHLARAGRRRRAWFSNYATTVVERMVADVADVERLAALPALFRLCASRTANELNVRAVADDLGLPYRTVGAYLTHLESVFLVQLLPGWSTNLTSKVVRRPKLVVTDAGLAASVIGADADALAAGGGAGGAADALLETFVVMEVRKQLGWSETDAAMFHFRDRGGAEVDIVLEAPDGRVAAVEVKAASTARAEDFRGLRLLADRLGDRFVGGVVLYTGADSVPFGPRLAALPIAALWEGN